MPTMRRVAGAAVLWLLFLASGAAAQQVDWATKALQSERSRAFDALHYRIAITLDLDQKSFAGQATITLAALTDGLDTVVLDAEEFTVTRVVNEWGEPLEFSQSERELSIRLRRPLTRGEVRSVTSVYAGKDPKNGLRFVAESADNPALVYSDSWPNRVHHWFPCFDYPNDKATSEILATVAADLKVAANGRLVSVSKDPDGRTVTYHWSQDLPHSTYLVFLAAAPYVVVPDAYGPLPVNYWVYPQHASMARATYGKTPAMIAFFNRTFGYDYPWQKYDQISVPSGGGAESTSATAMTHRIMVDERNEAEFSAIGIVSHEIAHQWWGDLITLRSWAHTWLNESFATYSDYLYARHERGDQEGAVNLQNKLNAYLREAKTRYVRPIVSDRYDQPQDMFDSHTYPKGALVIHMLRQLLGDAAFFDTLKHFLHRYAFEPVDTGDFIRSVKTVTGQNLDWFFDQWLFKPGHPVFDVRSEWDASRRVVVLTVAQVQDFGRGIPLFRVPVTVAIDGAQGRTTKRLWIREREERFELPAETQPLLVRFDPENVLLKEVRFPKQRDELIYQLTHDDVIGRMEAAAGLAELRGDAGALAALVTAARRDPFWAVRRASVEGLAKAAGASHAAVLREAALDPHPSVRGAALVALGDLKDRTLLAWFKERFAQDGSDGARAESLRAIGKLGDREAVPFLEQCVAVASYRNLIATAARQAIVRIEGK